MAPNHGAPRRDKVALRSRMGQRRGHVVSVARLIKADVAQRVTRVPEVDEVQTGLLSCSRLDRSTLRVV